MRRLLLTVTLVLCAVPASAQEPHKWPLHLAIGASMTADGADLATTMFAMGRGGFREANPLFRPLVHQPVQFAVAKMGGAAVVSYLLVRIHPKHPRLAVVLAVANTILKSYVAIRNQHLIEQKEHR